MSSDQSHQAAPLLLLSQNSRPSLAKPERRQENAPSTINQFREIVISILGYIMIIRPKHLRNFGRRIGYALVPQILRTRIWKENPPISKQFSTSYLNGLRGCTALKVFTFHYICAFSDIGFQPWGTDDRHRYVLELPIIRYFYSGFTSHIFFGVAGYLTSIRLIQMIESPDPVLQAKALSTISSSLFRRAFRLYLPVFTITLITATWINTGLYEHWRPVLLNRTYFPGAWDETKPDMFPTYADQLRSWGSEMYDLTNICTDITFYPLHDQHLWSILSEMRASLHLYGCLLALGQCRNYVRLILLFALAGLYFYWNHWEVWVYILGATAAQIDILLTKATQEKENRLPSSFSHEKLPKVAVSEVSPTPTSSPFMPLMTIFRFLAFLIAFYFLSFPIDSPRDFAPGYMTLNKLIPDWMDRKDKFYPNIGTFMLILLLVRANPATSYWRRFLNSPVPQYMGSISFGFYLVHGPIMHFWGGYMIPVYFWRYLLGKEGGWETTDMQWFLGIWVGWSITLGVSLWVADVFMREVEGRCVRLVKNLEKKCFHG